MRTEPARAPGLNCNENAGAGALPAGTLGGVDPLVGQLQDQP